MEKQATSLAEIFAKLLEEDEIDYRRRIYLEKNRKLQGRMWELKEKAENRWHRKPIADYEEVVNYINSICREMDARTYRYVR